MNLDLEPRQWSVLLDVLESYLSELRYEISNTDSMKFRDALKEKKELLNEIVRKLKTPEAA